MTACIPGFEELAWLRWNGFRHGHPPLRKARSRSKAADRSSIRSSPVSRPAWTRIRLPFRSEEHTSELQSLMRISYAVFCLKKKNNQYISIIYTHNPTTKTNQ